MQKNERKFDVLYAIIRDYIKTAEPVGSRTIEKKYNLGISSATIRNEMADLEEMGYLIQPHTSSGRIPSDKAYRLYVDKFLNAEGLSEGVQENVRDEYHKYLGELNQAVEKTAEILTKLTNYTALVMTPKLESLNIKDIKLIHIENERALLIVITKEGIVKNAELKFKGSVRSDQLEKVANFLNLCKEGIDSAFLVENFNKKIRALDKYEQEILEEVVPAIQYVMNEQRDKKIYADGVTSIFNYPEFQNMQRAKQFIDTLHKQDLLSFLLNNAMDESVHFSIGNENGIEELSDCSVVTATYKFNGRPIGSIGVVGPTRMDYDRCVSALNVLTQELTNHINEIMGGSEDVEK